MGSKRDFRNMASQSQETTSSKRRSRGGGGEQQMLQGYCKGKRRKGWKLPELSQARQGTGKKDMGMEKKRWDEDKGGHEGVAIKLT